jgi:ATP-dependent Clp protease ATP-binding subunit ClpC
MFERFTESARRALFFARYEASEFGSLSIETEHMLLGLVREEHGIVHRILQRADVAAQSLRDEIKTRVSSGGEKIATSIEIPFSSEVKRLLMNTAEEADAMQHAYIGKEHLLLALIREESSVAGTILAAHGLRLETVRNDIALLAEAGRMKGAPPGGQLTSDRIEQIKWMVQQLGQAPPDTPDAHTLVEHILRALDSLKPPVPDEEKPPGDDSSGDKPTK